MDEHDKLVRKALNILIFTKDVRKIVCNARDIITMHYGKLSRANLEQLLYLCISLLQKEEKVFGNISDIGNRFILESKESGLSIHDLINSRIINLKLHCQYKLILDDMLKSINYLAVYLYLVDSVERKDKKL